MFTSPNDVNIEDFPETAANFRLGLKPTSPHGAVPMPSNAAHHRRGKVVRILRFAKSVTL
jgi:hypothetical protein